MSESAAPDASNAPSHRIEALVTELLRKSDERDRIDAGRWARNEKRLAAIEDEQARVNVRVGRLESSHAAIETMASGARETAEDVRGVVTREVEKVARQVGDVKRETEDQSKTLKEQSDTLERLDTAETKREAQIALVLGGLKALPKVVGAISAGALVVGSVCTWLAHHVGWLH